MNMSDKVALVTGAGAGIGRAAALKFAADGAKVIVSDVNIAGGEETAHLIEDSNGEAAFIRADVSKADEVEALVQFAVSTYGRLDYAVNNAGISGVLAFTHEANEEDWDQVININLKGVWLCMKYELCQMLEQGSGAIVNTASVAGLVGLPNAIPYAASKHGVIGLTKTAALEYASRGIRVNAVCPGYTETAMVAGLREASPVMARRLEGISPMKRLGTPEEIADAIVWLCSDHASFISGHALALDGGYVAS